MMAPRWAAPAAMCAETSERRCGVSEKGGRVTRGAGRRIAGTETRVLVHGVECGAGSSAAVLKMHRLSCVRAVLRESVKKGIHQSAGRMDAGQRKRRARKRAVNAGLGLRTGSLGGRHTRTQ